jgi:ABC-type uncharacterized transport system permease subunit
VLCLLVRPDFSAVTPLSFSWRPGVVLGFGISFLLGATITCVAFWTTRIYSLAEFYWAFVILFSGQFVPLDLMPPFIQQIAQFLPFQLLKYFPIQLILKLPEVIVRDFVEGVSGQDLAGAFCSLARGCKRSRQ